MSLRWLTAGESHGPMLVATIDGVPAGLSIDEELLALDLARRQQGYGRGGRMKIETDRARIVAGVRHGRTLGAPIALIVENRDHKNWLTRMKPGPLAEGEDPGPKVTLPRPGHADLAGSQKYGFDDLRNVLERASARETAARVALGGIAKALLRSLDITVGSQVVSIHEAEGPAWDEAVPDAVFNAELLSARADASEVRSADEAASAAMIDAIKASQKRRDTVGGVFEVVIVGLPPGIGSHVQRDRRLDGRLMAAMGGIQAIKGAEVGDGWGGARRYGTEVHDPIVRFGTGFGRSSNHAGGTEGGMSNGEPLVVRAAMKPIATVSNALPSVDFVTGEVDKAHVERSDTCAVPAAAVVGESMAALCVAELLLETWGADTLDALRGQVKAAWRRSRLLPGHVYLAGLSGSGKSTSGPLLAKALGLAFVDLDQEIVKDAGMDIPTIFKTEGEDLFRQRELAALRRVIAGPRAVVALGGGAPTRREARSILHRTGDVLWLKADASVLAARLGNAADRPLLKDDPEGALRRLQDERAQDYALCADAVVDADASSPEALCERMRGALGALR